MAPYITIREGVKLIEMNQGKQLELAFDESKLEKAAHEEAEERRRRRISKSEYQRLVEQNRYEPSFVRAGGLVADIEESR